MTARSGEQFASLPSGIDICYETFGNPGHPAILLVMGLGGPMGWWSEDFCERLSGRGYFVIRYDTRDTGRSTKLRQHKVGKLDVVRAFAGFGKPPYGIGDMAEDAFGLLDQVEHAHPAGLEQGSERADVQRVAVRQFLVRQLPADV